MAKKQEFQAAGSANIKRPIDVADGAASAAAMGGAGAADSAIRDTTVASVFEPAEPVITRNEAGGHGFYAEAHHTASFEINAGVAGADVHAQRPGSNDFASADVVLSTGETFQVKFYETAADTWRASSELLTTADGPVAKYAGDTIVVPSDQLADIQARHQAAINEAVARGDLAEADALRALTFDDQVIGPDGVTSLPLSYDEAQQGVVALQNGELPEFAGAELNLGAEVMEGALLAAAMSAAVTMGPDLVRSVGQVLRGDLSKDKAIDQLKATFSSAQNRDSMVNLGIRGAGSAALTAINSMDPMGAVFVANVLIDTAQLTLALQRGEMDLAQYRSRMFDVVQDRAIYTGLTAASVWALGPPGILVPIIARTLLRDDRYRTAALEHWREVSAKFEQEMQNHLRTLALMDVVQSRYAQTEAAVDESGTRAVDVQKRLNHIAGLLEGPNGKGKTGE